MLPKLNKIPSSNEPAKKKTPRKTAKQLSEERIEEINKKRTKLPKTELDSQGRPILNIPGMDDLDISNSFNKLLGKDYGDSGGEE